MTKKKTTGIGIIGNGSWGTALAKILTDNGHAIHWWVRNAATVAHMKQRNHNPGYLTVVRFEPGSIFPTDNLQEVLDACHTLIIAIPSAFAQAILERVDSSQWQGKQIISAIKGILPGCNLLLNDYLQRHTSHDTAAYVAITGPCHAEEVAQERLSYLTFSGLNDQFAGQIAATFRNHYINTTSNHDIWGAQYAAVLKNIYAIGAGIAHALDYGDNFLSVYITNCYREMYQFLHHHFTQVHPSSQIPDFHTSAYLGDLLVTCYSLHSRNRTFGTMIGKGYTIQSAILEMNMVAEGYHAAKGMQDIAASYDIPVPIAGYIYQILWEKAKPETVFAAIEKILD